MSEIDKYYKKDNEKVYKEDAFEYMKDKLGLKIEPKGIASSYTDEQMEFIISMTEWYFSDWIEDVEENEDEDMWENDRDERMTEYRQMQGF